MSVWGPSTEQAKALMNSCEVELKDPILPSADKSHLSSQHVSSSARVRTADTVDRELVPRAEGGDLF